MLNLLEKIIPTILGGLFGIIGTLILGIAIDIMTIILSIGIKASPETIIRIISLLSICIIFSLSMNVYLVKKIKQNVQSTYSGKYNRFQWYANIYETNNPYEKYRIYLRWLCPVHKVFLHKHKADVPEADAALCQENCMVASLLSCNYYANPLRGTGGTG
jgi:hypothetical protein